MAKLSKIHLSVGPRQVKPLKLAMNQIDGVESLRALGIGMDSVDVMAMAAAHGYAMDDLTTPLLANSNAVPLQFLQQWLTGFVHIVTQARKIDDIIGIQTVGAWEDEEIVQGTIELAGKPVPYGDSSMIPLSSWNANYESRSVVRFEEGMQVGKLEESRTARVNISSSSSKREAAAMALDILRNSVGFYGFNSGINRTYGYLNDPALAAYVAVPNGAGGTPQWSTKTFLEICADIRTTVSGLRSQSGDTVDPETVDITMALATDAVDFLSVTSDFGVSVRDWLTKTYPRIRVVSAPELNDANGGANVMYMQADSVSDSSTDDGRTWAQMVPSKFQLVGVEQRAKGYTESYSNALAGVLLKRPYAVIRRTGI